jgi:glycyl-tRNA synthetase alpha chain
MPVKKKVNKKNKSLSFQDIIMSLQKFWGRNGCVILQPYDLEVDL